MEAFALVPGRTPEQTAAIAQSYLCVVQALCPEREGDFLTAVADLRDRPHWSHRIPELCAAVGKESPIEAGDCVCIWVRNSENLRRAL